MGVVRTLAGLLKIAVAITVFFGVLGGASFGAYLHLAPNTSLADFQPNTTTPTPPSTPTPTPPAQQHVPTYPLNATWDTRTDPDDPGNSTFATSKETVTAAHVEYHIHKQVNTFRQQQGLAPFTPSHYLSSVSRAHSYDMAVNNFFGHINSEGEAPWQRFGSDWREHCPNGYSENIAANWLGTRAERPDGSTGTARTAKEIATVLVSQWKHSDEHRENILTENWTAVGTGVYIHDRGTSAKVYATQNFCGQNTTEK